MDTNNWKVIELRLEKLRGQSEKDDQMKRLGRLQVQYQKLRLVGNQSLKSEEDSGNDIQESIY